MSAEIIVADIGGTNTRIGVGRSIGGKMHVSDIENLTGGCDQSFADSLSQYSNKIGRCIKGLDAILAVAGPVSKNRVSFTNRNMIIDGDKLTHQFHLNSVVMINDFVAMARSVPEIKSENFKMIKSGKPNSVAPIIVAGPGTGFGVATLIRSGEQKWSVIEGEGGYHSYAPRTKVEMQLVNLLQKEHDFISTELVCAGVGLKAVHKAMAKIYGREYKYVPPADMLKLANDGDELFNEIIEIRARGVMSAMADFVLINGALGGAVIAGGVAERIANYLVKEESLNAFTKRGLKTSYLKDCPIHLITDPYAPLTGAAASFYDQ